MIRDFQRIIDIAFEKLKPLRAGRRYVIGKDGFANATVRRNIRRAIRTGRWRLDRRL